MLINEESRKKQHQNYHSQLHSQMKEKEMLITNYEDSIQHLKNEKQKVQDEQSVLYSKYKVKITDYQKQEHCLK